MLDGRKGLYMANENVIVVSFAEDSSAYEAFTNLKELGEQRQVSIKGAAVVQRGEDGRIVIKDSVESQHSGTTTGGLIGLLVGSAQTAARDAGLTGQRRDPADCRRTEVTGARAGGAGASGSAQVTAGGLLLL